MTRRRFVSAGDGSSKWMLESQAQADYREARQEPVDSATVTALRAKVAELEKRLEELEHCDDRD